MAQTARQGRGRTQEAQRETSQTQGKWRWTASDDWHWFDGQQQVFRAEEDKRLAMMKKEEEERLRREIEEKKQKEMEEKRRRLAEVEQKRQAADKASKVTL